MAAELAAADDTFDIDHGFFAGGLRRLRRSTASFLSPGGRGGGGGGGLGADELCEGPLGSPLRHFSLQIWAPVSTGRMITSETVLGPNCNLLI